MGSVSGSGRSGPKLTIAHFMPWSGIGGVEISALRLTEALRDQFRSVAFCLADNVALQESFQKLGIETRIYAPPEPSLRHVAKYYRESRTLARQLLQAGVDIVHFTDVKAAYHNSLAALLARTRRVCHIQSVYSDLSLRERLSLLPVQSFIFVSKAARQDFALSLPDSRARVVYNPIEVPDSADRTENNLAVRSEFGVPLECTLIGMVARVAPVKDYYTLASAAAEVLRRYPDTRFLIVGDNSQVELNRHHYQEVVQRLNELGIADRFIFTGHRDDVPRLIAAMDISVLCSHREGFGLCIVESMAMGKPVVATDVGGIPEIIQPGITGYLHQHGSSEELARRLIALIEDPAKANRFGRAGYERVQKNFSLPVFVDEVSKAYWDVMRQ